MKTAFSKTAAQTSGTTGYRIAHALASRTMLVILVVLAVLSAGWLIWQQAIVLLRVEANLPAGISNESLVTNISAAQTVGQQRSNRAIHSVRTYTRFAPLFVSRLTSQP